MEESNGLSVQVVQGAVAQVPLRATSERSVSGSLRDLRADRYPSGRFTVSIITVLINIDSAATTII